MKKCYSKILFYFLPLCIIMIFCLYHIGDNYAPKVFGDEYGYWASGAYFAGIDWSDITSMNEYYGWGYGILLSIILRLPINASICYKFAIGLNGIFVFLSYCFALKLADDFFINISEGSRAIIAFAAAILPSTLYYTQYTSCECILTCVYWMLIYFAWNIIKNGRFSNIITFLMINFFLLAIHMRTIGIIAVSFIFVVSLLLTNRCKLRRRLFVLIGIGILMVVGLLVIKGLYQNSYINSLVELRTNNELAGQTSKLANLFSLASLMTCTHLFLGRLLSLSLNSYLLALCAIIGEILAIKNEIKEKKLKERELFFLIVLLNTLSQIVISSIYMMEAEQSRFDILTYSRYHEFTVGILFLLGMVYLIEMVGLPNTIKYTCCTGLIVIILAMYVSFHQNYKLSLSNCFIHNPHVYYWIRKTENINMTFILATLFIVLIFIIFQVLIVYCKNWAIIIFCFFVIVINTYENNYVFVNGCLSWSIEQTKDVFELKKYIEKYALEDNLYFMTDDNVLYVDQLQFLLKNHEIHIANKETLSDAREGIVISSKYYNESEFEDNGFVKIDKFGYLFIWERETNDG